MLGVHVIPKPLLVEFGTGACRLRPGTRVEVDPGDDEVLAVAESIRGWLGTATGQGDTEDDGSSAVVRLARCVDADLGAEGYRLEIGRDVVLSAPAIAGLRHGFQTLRQLLPAAAETPALAPRSFELPAMTVCDRPRFSWRGMHLDVARHFFSPVDIERYLDLMALHKQNVLHWHLTDDQGWRLRIDRWPRLTDSGEFYTKGDVRRIVASANERGITIVPEIEMPGHAQAAIAAYPWLGNTGQVLEVARRGGVSKHVFGVDEAVFSFLEDVLSEVVELFPGPYVHIGGDECPKDEWRASPSAQRRITEEGLGNEDGLQSWFIRRIQKHLARLGRNLVGWDEIQEGGLAAGATVMVWRDASFARQAIELGHDVVMTPTTHCYFDYRQGDVATEPPASNGPLPASRVYEFEPVPPGVDARAAGHILGTQGNVWTEHIADFDHLAYMAFPRACAIAEVAWTAPDSRDWRDFVRRWAVHCRRLDALGVNYRQQAD